MTTSKFNHIFWIIGFIGAITKEKPLLSKEKTIHDSKHFQRVSYNNLATSTTTTKKWGNTQNLALLRVTTLHIQCCIYHPNIKSQMKNVRSFIVSSFLYGMRIDAKINMMKKPNANAIA